MPISSGADVVTTLNRHLFNVSCLLGCTRHFMYTSTILPDFLCLNFCSQTHFTSEQIQDISLINFDRVEFMNKWDFRPPLCTYRLNSWGWWDEWDDTALQTQDSKFEPWGSEAEHVIYWSWRFPKIVIALRVTSKFSIRLSNVQYHGILLTNKREFVASELKDPICHSDECQIGSFSSEATNCWMTDNRIPHNSQIVFDSPERVNGAHQQIIQNMIRSILSPESEASDRRYRPDPIMTID